ncbi:MULTISPECIES: hypothetical protein [unclassified Inquilinus]
MPLSASVCVAVSARLPRQTRHELDTAADVLDFAAGVGSVIEILG